MKKDLLYPILILLLVGCSSVNNRNKEKILHINVESAVQNPTAIKASMLGENIRYVILENTDSSIIGQYPVIQQYKDKLIVASQKSMIKVFNADDGKFLCSIGKIGRGPQESMSINNFVLNPYNGEILICATNSNKYHVWDVNGNYLRSVTPISTTSDKVSFIPNNRFEPINSERYIRIDDDQLIFYSENDSNYVKRYLPLYFSIRFEDIGSVEVSGGRDYLKQGSLFTSGGFVNTFDKSGKMNTTYLGEKPFYRIGDELNFKSIYNDTVFTVGNNSIEPRIVFDQGKYRKFFDNRNVDKEDWLKIGQLLENDDFILFECNYKEGYLVLFSKNDNKLISARYSDKIVDDINNYVPFNVHTMNAEGNCIGIIDPLDIVEWNENNSSKNNLLPNVNENSNPVIVIIE